MQVDSIKQLIDEAFAKNAADIRRNADTRPRLQLRLVIPLDTAAAAGNPLVIPQPFDAFYVEAATDSSTSVNLSLTSREAQNIAQYTTIKQNDSGRFGSPISGCLLTWAAQTGKTLTLVLYLGIEFRPGSQISVVSGGVNITGGTGATEVNSVSVATTATSILAADTSRKRATITNLSSSDLYIGGTTSVVAAPGRVGAAGAKYGKLLGPGASIEVDNTGAIYGIADAVAGVVGIVTES